MCIMRLPHEFERLQFPAKAQCCGVEIPENALAHRIADQLERAAYQAGLAWLGAKAVWRAAFSSCTKQWLFNGICGACVTEEYLAEHGAPCPQYLKSASRHQTTSLV